MAVFSSLKVMGGCKLHTSTCRKTFEKYVNMLINESLVGIPQLYMYDPCTI